MPSGILFDLARFAPESICYYYKCRDRSGNFVLLLVSVTALKKEKVKVGR